MNVFQFKEKRQSTLKCGICGRFVSYDDLHSGKATHTMITPDSELTFEEWETICAKCKKSGWVVVK